MNLRFYQNIETGEIVFLHSIEKGFCYSISEKTKHFKFDNLGYESKEQFFRRHKIADAQSDYFLSIDDDGNYYIGKKRLIKCTTQTIKAILQRCLA